MTDIPLLGLGTWDLRGKSCVRTVHEALELGYRHVDTAEMYENEREVGRAISASGLSRNNVFLTTKLWHDNLTRSRVPKHVEDSLKRLGADYVDLLLIHWPNEKVPLGETLGAMNRLREEGKTRAIGVSNFPVAMWREALEIAPVNVNQVELHPYLTQNELRRFAGSRGLQLTAYRPVMKGRVNEESVLEAIAGAHDRTPAQVSLRWLVQQGVSAIPKASRRDHLEENLKIFDFELTEEEMARISALDRGLRFIDPGWAPAWD